MRKLSKISAVILALLFSLAVVIDILSGEAKSVNFYIAALVIAVIFIGYALKKTIRKRGQSKGEKQEGGKEKKIGVKP